MEQKSQRTTAQDQRTAAHRKQIKKRIFYNFTFLPVESIKGSFTLIVGGILENRNEVLLVSRKGSLLLLSNVPAILVTIT